jgi:hypothetical protein
VARPNRFRSLVVKGTALLLEEPVAAPCYWFERSETGQEIWLVVDGKTVVLFYLNGRNLDTCTFAYHLTPAQLNAAVRVMKKVGLQRFIVPAAEWAIREMPEVRRPVLEDALRRLVSSVRRGKDRN